MFDLSSEQADIIGSVLLYLSSSLSSAGGVGGGALNVPILYLIWGFSYTDAVILSLATLMGNYLLQVLINLSLRHPIDLTRPLIYWDAILILLPAELGGSNIGVILEKIFPTSLDLIMGMVVLVIAFSAALSKGIDQYNKETILLNYGEGHVPLVTRNTMDEDDEFPLLGLNDDGMDGADVDAAESGPPPPTSPSVPRIPLTESILNDFDKEHPSRRRKLLGSSTNGSVKQTPGGHRVAAATVSIKERARTNRSFRTARSTLRRMPTLTTAAGSEIYDLSGVEAIDDTLPAIEYPWFIITVILVVWLLYAALYISMADVTSCSWIYFVLLISIYPLLLLEIFWGMYYLQEKQEHDKLVGMFVKGDIDWKSFSFAVPLFAFVVGMLSSLLGIGGGELMGPMLLQLGVLPVVSPATTSLMSFLNTSSSFVHYLSLGEVPYTYAAWVFGIGAAGGITGRMGAILIARNYGRPSVMVFTLCAVLVISFGLYVYDVSVDDLDFTFSSLC